jgi:glyoxylase-like metal-dependent hydrolase (beta-lactamase superfamily II)
MMELQVLNCGTMHPRGARLFVPDMEASPCLCLLIDTGDGLVLVDTGLGTRDMDDPNGRLGYSNLLLNARRDQARTALRQVEKKGFGAERVTDIICTHLDRDHAGGLPDFPEAKVHVLA